MTASGDKGKVTIGWIHPGTESTVFSRSLRMLRLWDLCNSQHIQSGFGELDLQCANGMPSDSRVVARNNLVTGFLEDPRPSWLLWLDADMGFDHHLLDRLLAVADADTRPIVGALCFGGAKTVSASFGGHRSVAVPTIYDCMEDEDAAVFVPRLDYEHDAVVECGATGSACILVHRTVFETVAAAHGAGSWYKQITHPKAGNTFGEDLSFCIRARACGFPVFVDTSVKTTHDKGWAFLDEDYYRAQQGDHPGQLKVRVATGDSPAPRLNRADRRRMARQAS